MAAVLVGDDGDDKVLVTAKLEVGFGKCLGAAPARASVAICGDDSYTSCRRAGDMEGVIVGNIKLVDLGALGGVEVAFLQCRDDGFIFKLGGFDLYPAAE